MKGKATIKDVGKLAGVSFKTVSRVINKEPNVGEELKARVLAAVKELNYHPNISAKQMRGSSSFIGFIYDNPNSHYVIEMQRGILDECRKQGFELVIHPCDSKSPGIIDELLNIVDRNQIGGLILTPPLSESSEIARELAERKVKTVRILSATQAPANDPACIYIDDRGAAREITKHLIEMGHSKIAFLSGEEEHHSSIERRNGYLDALKENGIDIDPSLIIEGQYSFESGVERTRELLQREVTPTAIFACNDEIAAGTLFAARLLGLSVPEDISIIGFEDSPFSRQTWPKLSTARQPNNIIAQRATSLLIDTIKQRAEHISEEEKGFHPKLVIRDSVCPPSQRPRPAGLAGG